MQHPAGLAHVIRQQGLGDRVVWGKWCYEELASYGSKAVRRRVARVQTHGAPIFSYDATKVINFWRIGPTMNQSLWVDGDV